MNTTPEQIQIVRTVVNEFLPVADDVLCAEKVLGIVRKYSEGSANQATTRCGVRDALVEINQHPDDERLDLCIGTAHALVCGYLRWKQAQDDVNILLEYPALELLQLFKRDELVDWTQRWRESGGRVFLGGRMIALHNHPVWTQISFFRLPFPPFDLESGMRVEPVARYEAEELGLLALNEQVKPNSVDLDFAEALRTRVEFYFGPEGRRQRFERELEQADIKALLEMAHQRIGDEDNEAGAGREAIFILEHALKLGFRGNWEDQAKAYGLLSEAHALVHQREQADGCSSKQLETFEAWVASGITTDGNQRARVCSQVAEVYQKTGQSEEASRYRKLAEDSRTGYSLFFEARQRVQGVGGMNAGVAREVIPILEQAAVRGFDNSLQDEVNAYALLVAAYDALQDTEKARHYRSHQLARLEAWIAKGIPTESDRRAKAYGQAAAICEKTGQVDKAASFRQLEDESRDGLSLLSEALDELKACGKGIDKENGARILEKLTKSANRVPESSSERHAEIYRATGRILDAWGNAAEAIEYYEYALEKYPKIAVKGRLDILRRRASMAAAGGGSRKRPSKVDIHFSCIGCGQHVVIDEAAAGMTLQCPKCGASLTAPNSHSTELARVSLATAPEPALLYTLCRGRGPAKLTQISKATYFYRKQIVEGPFNKLEMRALMRKKILEPETMVLCPATHEWQPCERFPELPKPAHNKLLHFERDSRFVALVQEIPRMIVEEIAGKISEANLRTWLVRQIQECGYQCPDYDEGTINDLVSEDRVGVIVRTNRQTWLGYVRYLQQGGSPLTNKPVLIGF